MNPLWLILICPACFAAGVWFTVWAAKRIAKGIEQEGERQRDMILKGWIQEHSNAN